MTIEASHMPFDTSDGGFEGLTNGNGTGKIESWPVAPSNNESGSFRSRRQSRKDHMARNSNPITIRRLYASTTATTSDAAHIDIPYGCRIVGLDLTSTAAVGANGDQTVLEISTASIGQPQLSDAGGILANLGMSYVLATNGAANLSANKYVGPTGITLPPATRIYLHVYQVGSSATKHYCNLHLQPI